MRSQESITRQLASFAASHPPVASDVRLETQRVLLDTLGCCLGGLATQKGRLAAAHALQLGGPEGALVLGSGRRVSIDHATFANAELANSLDADAIFLNISHVVPSLVPAALAAAEQEGAGAAELVDAIAIGHELAARLTLALTPIMVGDDGTRKRYVVSPVYGYGFAAIGVAATVGRLLRLDAERMAHAIGLAAYYCPVPSLLKWLQTTPLSMVKYSPVGWTAQAGVSAALLARSGFTGDTTVLDNSTGFAQFWGTPRYESSYLVEGLGTTWESTRWLSYKPYPVCNLYRAHLWFLDQLAAQEHLQPQEVEYVILRTLAPAGANRPYTSAPPDTQEAVHMSAEFVIALWLKGVPAGPRWVDPELAADPEMHRLMQLVRVEGNPGTAVVDYRPWHGKWLPDVLNRARSEIVVRARGRDMTLRSEYAYGDVWGPTEAHFTDAALRAKFEEMTRRALAAEACTELADLVLCQFADDGVIQRMFEILESASSGDA